jgi:competence protein ComEC
MVLLEQRLHLFPWSPVFLAIGIGLYFLLRFEPGWTLYAPVCVAALASIALALRWGPEVSPLFWAVGLVCLGLLLAGARAHSLQGPVLDWRYYGPIQGRVVQVDRSGSDALRLTLDRVVLRDVAPQRRPDRVRVSMHGDWDLPRPKPGQVVMMTGHLSPPAGAVEPGGFDFRRHAYFRQLGAVGYTRNPVVLWQPHQGGVPVAALRAAYSARVQAALEGDAGAFAAAVMTGDRSGMRLETLAALRASNLAHLLAISGLHMGLLAGVVFAAARLAFALVPYVGLRVPAKKIAAGIALIVAALYLLLSGGSIATERAFVMVAVMLVAVVFDRRAISLRAVAVAALIVLLLRPEALLSPGFQMSFSATTALVAVFGWLRDAQVPLGPRWLRPVVAVVISSAVAGAATAPFGAAHFNQLSQLGLIANLLSVPLMGALVIPAAVFATCLLPFGLEAIGLWFVGLGLDWILGVAEWVAGMGAATRPIPTPDWRVLPLLSIGALGAMLWQGRGRWAGLIPVGVALGLWATTPRPFLLIDQSGALVGVMTEQGRALNKPKGQGFVARSWLENDGGGATQIRAASLWPQDPVVDGWHLRVVSGKAASSVSCAPSDWLISGRQLPENLPCRVMDRSFLRQSGSIAVYQNPGGIRMTTERETTGCRLWTRCGRAQ